MAETITASSLGGAFASPRMPVMPRVVLLDGSVSAAIQTLADLPLPSECQSRRCLPKGLLSPPAAPVPRPFLVHCAGCSPAPALQMITVAYPSVDGINVAAGVEAAGGSEGVVFDAMRPDAPTEQYVPARTAPSRTHRTAHTMRHARGGTRWQEFFGHVASVMGRSSPVKGPEASGDGPARGADR